MLDIGGVLEVTPATGWQQRWAHELGLSREDFDRRLGALWRPGATGAASLAEIEQQTAQKLGLDERQLQRLTTDISTSISGRSTTSSPNISQPCAPGCGPGSSATALSVPASESNPLTSLRRCAT